MRRKRTNRKKWRRGTAMFLASLLALQVFTGNIAGVKALEFSSGEEQAADSGYEVSDYDQSEDTVDEENYDVNEENLDTENSGDVSEEKSSDNSQEEKSDSGNISTDEQGGNPASGSENGSSTAENENDGSANGNADGNTASGNENGSGVSGSGDTASGNQNGNTASGSENGNGTSNSGNSGAAADNSGSNSGNSASGDESSADDKNSPSGDGTSAADESTASGDATSAADESTTAGTETGAADESTSAGSETTAAGTETTAAIESSTAETTVPETKAAQQIALFAENGTLIDMTSAAGDLWIYNYLQYKTEAAGEIVTGQGNYTLTGSTSKNINIGNTVDTAAYGDSDIDVYLNGLELTGTSTLTVYPIEELSTDENGENGTSNYTVNMTASIQSKIAKLVLADGARLNISLEDGGAGIEIGSIELGKNSVLTVTPGNGTVAETEAEAGEELTEEEKQIARAMADNDGGKFTVTGNFKGEGTVMFVGSGAGTVIVKQGIQADVLYFEGVSVEANRGNLEAESRLTVADSTISGANLLGYAKDAAGEKTLVFEGSNSLANVSSVGTTADGEAIVTIEGMDTFSSLTGVTFYQDHRLEYQFQKEDGTDGTPDTDWPVYYRTERKNQSANESVIGSHTRTAGSTDADTADETADNENTEYTYEYTKAGTDGVKLPEFSVTGYQYAGWTLSDDSAESGEQTPVKTLSGEHNEDLTLTLALESDPVTVTFDRGYKPDQNTNDDYSALEEIVTYNDQELGSVITLSAEPYRFGYTFEGWKVTTGTQSTLLAHDAKEYVVKLEDTDEKQTESTGLLSGLIHMFEGNSANQRTVNLEAVWTPKTYELRLFLNSAVSAENVLVLEGENKYSIEDYVNQHDNVGWNAESSQITFVPHIEYGENLSDYLTKKVGISSLPVLEDKRTDASKVGFNGWQTPNYNMIGDLTGLTFTLGSLLDNRGDKQTLEDYDTLIKKTPQSLTTQWGTASYTLKTDIVSGWDLLVDGVVQTPGVLTKMRNALTKNSTMSVKVKKGSTVSWRCSAKSPENFSLWNFSTDVTGTEFVPTEGQYSSGAQYLFFTAEMPAANVTAEHSSDLENLYIDVNESSITFEQNVELKSGRTANGFWYDFRMKGTTYEASDNKTLNVNKMSPAFKESDNKFFYEWDFSNAFRVTTQGEETQNSLTLVDKMDVYVKDCKFAANEAFKRDGNRRKLGDRQLERRTGNTSYKEYGNIIQDVESNNKYTVNITVEGKENSLGTIVQSRFNNTKDYTSTFNIKGAGIDESVSILSGMFLNADVNFSNLTLKEDSNSEVKSEYIVHLAGALESMGFASFTSCKVDAPTKRMHTTYGNITFQSNCDVKIGSIFTYSATRVADNTKFRCYGDCMGAYYGIVISGNASAVIDGNLLSTYSHWQAGSSVNTTGYLIVKGNRADFENFSMSNGTVIVNAAVIGRSCSISGGTLIANQLMNSPALYPRVSGDTYQYTFKGECIEAKNNGDNFPFLTYSQDNAMAGTYSFNTNAKIALLGYYELSGDRTYSTDLTATKVENPISSVLDGIIDTESGFIKKDPVIPDLKILVENNSSNNTNECIILGNTTYDTAAKKRSVSIKGNAEIYAAGNITFYNDTTVSGGTIYCGGTFGSKRDLTISDSANITAKEIGNSYDLTETENGFTRWEKTDIQGGTINTGHIGALTEPHGGNSTGKESRSTVLISDSSAISTENHVTYTTDTYINYMIGDEEESEFKNPDENAESVRHSGDDYDALSAANDTTIQPPALKAGGNGQWLLDSDKGEGVDTIASDAAFKLNGAVIPDANAYKNRERIDLYAVKNEYTLKVVEGADKINSIIYGGVTYLDIHSQQEFTVARDAEAKVILNGTSMDGKAVIWYQDTAGRVHNVKPNVETKAGNIELTFNIPAGNAEIHVTDELEIYLNRYEIMLTSDGFWTQYDEGDEDYKFDYLGDIVITQDNIETTLATKVNGVWRVMGSNDGTTAITEGKCETTNRLHIAGIRTDRRVTLKKVLMNGGRDEDKIFVDQDLGEVIINIDGAVKLLSTYMKKGSSLMMVGRNKKDAGDTDQDVVHFYAGTVGTNNTKGYINNGSTGETGDVTFSDLKILRTNERYLVYSAVKGNSKVIFDSCTMTDTLSNSKGIALSYKDVQFINSIMELNSSEGYTSQMLSNCTNLKISGGTLRQLYGASYGATAAYYGTSTFEITDGAQVFLNIREPSTNMTVSNRGIPETVTVKNGAELNVNRRIKLKNLILDADEGEELPTVRVGSQQSSESYNGYLLCNNLEIKKGNVYTGGLLISGYYDTQDADYDYNSNSDIIKALQNGTRISENGSLTLEEGTIQADEFIGGAKGGTISVKGGSVTSPIIGTLDKVYGYGRSLPKANEKWIYSYAAIPQKMTVDLSGGTVEIQSGTDNTEGYLGGMNSVVNMTGGTLTIGDNAVVGMSESHKKTLSDYYSSQGDSILNHKEENCAVTVSSGLVEMSGSTGSISAPYGKISISGTDTKVKVYNLQAERGDVSISDASGKNNGYNNPYSGTETNRKDHVGVIVSNLLTAENLTINKGAQVYADQAYAVVTDGKGRLSVPEGSGAGLYSNAYGELGISRDENDKRYVDKNGAQQTVFGSHMVSITYVLNPEDVIFPKDVDEIDNTMNPANYKVGDKDDSGEEKIDLQSPTCAGYYFLGWYTDPDLSILAGSSINTGLSSDLTLYAKWERIKVKFAVRIPVGESITATTLPVSEFEDISGWTLSADGTYYISDLVSEIEYGSQILGNTGVNMTLYNTKAMNVQEVTIADAGTSYTGSRFVDGSTLVTADLAEAYRDISEGGIKDDAVVVLEMIKNQKRRAVITFDLNKKSGKPSDAIFKENGTTAQTLKDTLGVEDSLASSKEFADSTVQNVKSYGLIQPKATGYTFIGWSTDPNAKEGDAGWVNSNNVFKTETTVYAIWKANTYRIKFEGGTNSERVWVTVGNNVPAANDTTVSSLEYYWVYDTPVTETSFCPVGVDGEPAAGAKELPYAWKEGNVFNNADGWLVADSSQSIGQQTVLNKSVISALDAGLGDPNGRPTAVALTLKASYSPVRVRYHLEGGTFKNVADGVMDTIDSPVKVMTPDYGTALKGYTKNAGDSTDGETVSGVITTTDEKGAQATYQVISTTADYYNNNKEYVDADYRNDLYKKGYTFNGWFTRETTTAESGETTVTKSEVGTTPRFQDVDVYAEWTANAYMLTLYNEDGNRTYDYTAFNAASPDSPIRNVPVTVGSEINISDSNKWPSRNGEWYAYNKDTTPNDNDKRFFLGVTFAALDPGYTQDSNDAGYQTYLNYAASVTNLQNSDSLFQNRTTNGSAVVEGTIFQLPEDSQYQSDIRTSYGTDTNNYTVPDYPNGCTISMYAVYRERSLVFVERYIDGNGIAQEKVLESGAWNQYSNFWETYKPNSEITSLGYALVGLYVNGTTTAAMQYPKTKAEYEAVMDQFKTDAETLGTYDIMVYTVYAAQLTPTLRLDASTSSKNGEQIAQNTYTLPASMESGSLRVSLLDKITGLKLVSKDVMEQHVYESTWTDSDNVTHTADDTVAIIATLKTGDSQKTIDLVNVTKDKETEFELDAGKGSVVTLTMYHSGVMTKKSTYDVNLYLSFFKANSNNENGLKDQWIKENIKVNLDQSLYDVTYTVQLPESAEKLTSTGKGWNAFTKPEDPSAMITSKTETVGYGSALTDELPEFEGYTAENKWFTDSTNGYNTLTMPVTGTNNGTVSVKRGYQPKQYKLSADNDVLQWWDITYTNGAADTTNTTVLGASETSVKYHSVVKFSPKANSGKTDPPQFVTLTLKDETGTEKRVVKLPNYGTVDGESYSFAMPAFDVHASRVYVQTLYLDDGTISITENGYKQNRNDGTVVDETWPGDYVILQCADNNSDDHETANVLNLAGDLTDRTIQLGNLNITSEDSIALAQDAKADLTVNYDDKASKITAKNILAAGSKTELKIHTGLMSENVEDITKKAQIKLDPSTKRAAIGGSSGVPEVGVIEVDNLDLNLGLPAGSSASGIGAGAKTGTAGGTVSVMNSSVSVDEKSTTSGYSGAWIGGTIVSDVTVENTVISKSTSNHMAGPVITDGETVVIKDSTIGDPDDTNRKVSDPVYAGKSLTIENSKIYQYIQDNLNSNNDATAPIGTKDGTTTVSGESQINTQYAGNGQKSDYYTGRLLLNDAKSDVYIWGTQIVELGNGSVEIEAQQVTQGETTDAVSHGHSRDMDYLLLEEKGTDGNNSDVTIESLGSSSKVTVRNPYGTDATNDEVTVKDLSVNADAEIVLEGNLMVNGKAALGSGKDLTVDAKAVDKTAEQSPYGITLNDSSLFGADAAFADGASYTQEGGKLTSAGDLGNKDGSGLDVKLTNVTTEVANLYAKNLKISGGSAKAGTDGTTGEIGSKPALGADGTADPTTVTLADGASVKAKTIGALGEENKTFTSVKAETEGTTKLDIHGDVVQDLYRLKYDTVTDALDVSGLDTVVRIKAENFSSGAADADAIINASTTICPLNGVPEKPGFGKGDVDSVFTCWYIWQEKAGSTDAERIGLAVSGTEKPEGMTGITTLTDATPDTVKSGEYYPTEKEDGTSTLLVHAWLKATGTATVKKDRLFERFNDGAEKVEICENHAFTAQLVSTGTAISGRDYALAFNSALPVGTDLTLTLADDPKSYYYYTVTEADATNRKKDFFFSEFKAMGSDENQTFAEVAAGASVPEKEIFLVAVDFADVKADDMATVKTSGLTMQFKMAPSKTDKDSTLELGSKLSCSFTGVTSGKLEASGEKVTVKTSPSGDTALEGRKLYLAAKVAMDGQTADQIPYGVKAVLKDSNAEQTGTWISRDTVLFEAGNYKADGSAALSDEARTAAFEGLKAGSYTLTWTLVYGESGTGSDIYNVLGNVLSNTANGEFTVKKPMAGDLEAPYLAVTTNETVRTITQGMEKNVGFNWTSTTAAENITVTVEKQGMLGNFAAVSGDDKDAITTNVTPGTVSADQPTTGTASATFKANVPAGTYRIVFSMDENSREDNVYFVFIVEENK